MGAICRDLEVLILPCGDAPIDLGNARLKLFFQILQVLLDRLLEDVEPCFNYQLVLISPLLIVEEIVFNLRSAHLTRVFSEFPSSHQNKTVWMGCGNGRTSAGTRSGGLSIPATRGCRT